MRSTDTIVRTETLPVTVVETIRRTETETLPVTETVLRTYAHLLPQSDVQAAEQVASLLAG
ncbi:MAG: hypothetical protein H0V94_03030 [Actinobacteria bacterium]|nr:hypothetical protein [Actinomycetota bacterium]